MLAQADAQTASLAKTLKQGPVVAHRVQAARLLGESDDPEAMPPLCAGLADESPEVRAAAASALEKLAEPGAVVCLEARKEETDPQVQAALTSALKSLRALQARPARLYVMLAPLKDTTGTLSPELVKLTEARLRRALFQRERRWRRRRRARRRRVTCCASASCPATGSSRRCVRAPQVG
ncbi:HEAT repeat domain-containing protein [Cystobacter fuscus]